MGSSRDALERCLQLCDTGDTVLFLDAGVMHVTGEIEPPGAGDGPAFSFSRPDLQARGLDRVARSGGAEVFEDSEFSTLLEAHALCLTWK